MMSLQLRPEDNQLGIWKKIHSKEGSYIETTHVGKTTLWVVISRSAQDTATMRRRCQRHEMNDDIVRFSLTKMFRSWALTWWENADEKSKLKKKERGSSYWMPYNMLTWYYLMILQQVLTKWGVLVLFCRFILHVGGSHITLKSLFRLHFALDLYVVCSLNAK